ncbi:MAG: ATP-binding cassette domain-containing protein [bacterium]
MQPTNIIEVKNLSKKYSNLAAVDDISFEVKRGEIFGFLGPNGAGKTTTVRILVGLCTPDSGTITICGLERDKNLTRIKERIGVVPDSSNLYSELSGFENLLFMAQLYRVEKKKRINRVIELLRQFDLYERKDDSFGTYSNGMRRRLTIAAALVHDPDILFMDEPTSGLDVVNSRMLQEIILEINKRGKTIFLVTHKIEDADKLCHRVAIIIDGKIKIIDTPFNLKESCKGLDFLEVVFNTRPHGLRKQFITLDYIEDVIMGEIASARIFTSELDRTLSELVKFKEENKLKILKIKTGAVSLEDAFVKITSIDPEYLRDDISREGRHGRRMKGCCLNKR